MTHYANWLAQFPDVSTLKLNSQEVFSLESAGKSYDSKGLILAAMEKHCGHIKVDQKLANEIRHYIQNFINKNPDHINALGSNLLGVYQMRFTPQDRAEWEEDLLRIDPYALRQDINQIELMKVAGTRATDTFNLTCVWLCHRFYISDLGDKQKHDAMKDTMVMLQYKFFSSLLHRYFQYSVDPNVAAAVYSELSKRFDIKRLGTWKDVIDDRAENIISPGEMHDEAIRFFLDDVKVVRQIQDIQYRLRDKFKNIWEVLEVVLEEDKRFGTNSHSIEIDGVTHTRDMVRLIPEYTRYIHEVVREAPRFMKPELMGIIEDAMPLMPAVPFERLLFMFHEQCKKNDKQTLEFVDLLLEHFFNVVLADRDQPIDLRHITEIIVRIRGIYTSSRGSNDMLMHLREQGEKFANKYVGITNEANKAALRTGLMLYVLLRTITKKHYG